MRLSFSLLQRARGDRALGKGTHVYFSEVRGHWLRTNSWFTRQNRGLRGPADRYPVQISVTVGPAGPQTQPVPEHVIGMDLRRDCEIYTPAAGQWGEGYVGAAGTPPASKNSRAMRFWRNPRVVTRTSPLDAHVWAEGGRVLEGDSGLPAGALVTLLSQVRRFRPSQLAPTPVRCLACSPGSGRRLLSTPVGKKSRTQFASRRRASSTPPCPPRGHTRPPPLPHGVARQGPRPPFASVRCRAGPSRWRRGADWAGDRDAPTVLDTAVRLYAAEAGNPSVQGPRASVTFLGVRETPGHPF